MGSQEVVMGHKQSGKGECAIDAVEAVGRFDMVLEGSVESFDELLVGSVGFGLRVKILESDDLSVLEQWVLSSLGIEEVDTCGIGRVSIGDKENGLFWICGANGFSHRDNSREGFSGVCDVVGRDLEVLGREEEEHIVMFSHDLNVGLIPCADVIDGALTGEVKAMAREGGCGGIVKDGLVGEGDTEDGSEDEGGFSGT